MENTYTYTARSAEHPEKVVTFTLHGRRMSVGAGAPLELVTQTVQAVKPAPEEEEEEEGAAPEPTTKLWLKPLAISLVEQGTEPFRVKDVVVRVAENWLQVRGWVRAGGLRLVPITLMQGHVDNADAAQAFAEEVAERQEGTRSLLDFLDYWSTWLTLALSLWSLFVHWRRRAQDEE